MSIKMTDVSDKKATQRTAQAHVKILASPGLIKKIRDMRLPKGDCLAAAQVAGILAAKNTPALIPLCHPVRLTYAGITFKVARECIVITSSVRAQDATGVEMEALAACVAAALTIYDMAKTEEKDIVISGLRLLKKTGGKSGTYICRKQ
jgi:cyclic pyranopterin phosphate synthase